MYKAPDSLQSDLIDLDVACKRYRFLVDENRWQQLIQERLSTWEDSTTMRFEYNADYGINDETIDVLMEKLEATNRERVELLGEANQTRTTENLRKNEVYKLFTKIEDTVNITFFSKDEYKIANPDGFRKQMLSRTRSRKPMLASGRRIRQSCDK